MRFNHLSFQLVLLDLNRALLIKFGPLIRRIKKQGRIHGCRNRARVGRSSNAKTARKRREKLTETDRPTDRPTDRHSGS